MRWLLVLILILAPSYKIGQVDLKEELIVWNIGQGQWVTWVGKPNRGGSYPGKDLECWHFDMGGEKDLSSRVSARCRGLKNRLFLSHWDLDHIGLVQKFAKKISDLCLALAPLGPTSERKKALLEGIPLCPENSQNSAQSLFQAPLGNPKFLHLAEKTTNHLSHVLYIKELKVLVPGDSTAQEEKTWAFQVPASCQGLILGHHGSQSSTSELLLKNLPHLKWAVSSARFSRYGHPHPNTVLRLKKHRVPLLRTEDWGTLHFLRATF